MSRDGESTLTTEDSLAGEVGTASSAYLFVLLCCDRGDQPSSRHRLAGLDEVVVGRGDGFVVERAGGRLGLRLADPRLSSRHLRLLRAPGGVRWSLEDAESKNGTSVNGVACRQHLLEDGDVVEAGHTFFLFRQRLAGTPGEPADLTEAQLAGVDPSLATLSPTLAARFAGLAQVAASEVSLIIAGETGTGKELLARGVHRLSGRRGPFLALNCGALPDTLIETELFGYQRGAFSGAVEDRPGLVRSAHRGTLFLDEIGDLPASSQTALLRVLQEREVLPVGATKATPVDIRVVAATHRDLDALVEAGEFRHDLLARLSGFRVTLPPLRERREDLGWLVRALLGRSGAAPALSRGAVRLLLAHHWPGNVRELENRLASAVALVRDQPQPTISREQLPDLAVETPRPAEPALSPDEIEQRARLIALLGEHEGNVTAVARVLGKARNQINRWIRRFGIDVDTFRAGRA